MLNCLINPEFSAVDIGSLEVHGHAALLVLLEVGTTSWTLARKDQSK